MSAPVDLGVSNLDDDTTVMPEVKMEPAVVAAPPKPKVKAEGVMAKYKKRVWIVLEDNENIPPTGQFIGHDGNGFMLRSGVAVEVPVELVEILNNAVYLAPVVDPQTRQIIDYRERLRFPYRVLPHAPDAKAA